MTKLPVVDFKTFARVLKQIGFESIRQRGSHVTFRHPDGRQTIVPYHKGESLSRPLLRDILRQINVSIDEYLRVLNDL